ncbi:MAG: ABC transporter permease [Candidatus Humimicrobiaceae bacterium]
MLVIGDMNLSAGAIGGLATITAGYFMQVHHMPGVIAVIIALIVGTAAGAFNGIVSTKLGINAFIVTLSTMFIYSGIIFGFTQGFAFDKIPESFTMLGKRDFFGIPTLFITAVIIFVIVYLYFTFTITGRRTLAVGENANAAKFSGINNENIKILSHSLSGFTAALAAVLYVSRLGTAQPTIGQDWLIISFAVAIIGGTSLNGGGITALGLLVGAIIMILIKNGLILLKTNVYWEQAFLGLLILIAVGIDRFRTVYNRKKLLE